VENGGETMDKKQSLPVKLKIILYVDQISWQREPSDQCTKSTPKKKEEKKRSKKASRGLCERRRQEERERERVCVCVSRLELHFRQNFRYGTDLVSSLKRRHRETRECTKREKRKEKMEKEKNRSMLRSDLQTTKEEKRGKKGGEKLHSCC
jgi:hypothetical protein